MSEFMEAALEYRARGWSVIPIGPRGKKPLVDWREYESRLPTEEEIRQWWTSQPNANVAVVTGRISGLVVVDVDPKRGGDPKGMRPTDFVVKTGSGGWHLYYEYPEREERVPNQAGKNGIDVRGDGGYVVAPPSVHPSGGSYEWKRGGEGLTLAPCPPQAVYRNGHSPSTAPAEKEPWVATALQGVGAGQRNDMAARLVGYFIKKGLPPDILRETMRSWNLKNEPPLSDRELDTVIESVPKTAERSQQRKQQEPPIATTHHEGRLLNFLGATEFLKLAADYEVEWTIAEWMPDNTIAMIVGPPETYKTWLELDLAVSIASGAPFLGHFPVNRRGPVLILQQEDYAGQLAHRLATITANRLDLKLPSEDWTALMPPDLPIHIHLERQFHFENSTAMDAMEERLIEYQPVMVIIDPLYSAVSLTDYMANSIKYMFRMKEWRDRFNCSFLLSHHTKKQSEGSGREDLWGSQFLNAFIETGWQIRPDRPDSTKIRIRRHFKVRSQIPEMMLEYDIDTTNPITRYQATLTEIGTAKVVTKDGVMEMLRSQSMTLTMLAKALNKDRSTVSKQIKKLMEADVVVQQGDYFVLKEV